ncbi:hypothetical protein CcCBS67573_g02245 [Chytriomyces confervae]|uniref:Enoyl reductase (ER) domain-containing protein n=1 Tax=Chytriomyces confervae TaxID=246404 RepID=A0A507FLD5_9FUNG|nr:hypothetical protein CcCBS67573_g02245 [Chytriomyces confervae]
MKHSALVVSDWLKTPSELRVSPLPEQPFDAESVRVRIVAAGINFADILMVMGKYQVKPPLPFVPGTEFAGVVDQVGSSVSGFKVGDRVFGSSTTGIGAFATSITLQPAPGFLFKIPEFLSFREAAASFIIYPTSWLALVEKGNLKKGEICLVHAAAGGVGSAAVQIAKHLGAIVIGTAGGPEKCAIVKDTLGADYVIDYTKTNWEKEVNKIVSQIRDKPGVDVIYDPVGTFIQDTKCIAWNGRILVVGFAGGNGKIEAVPANRLLLKGASLVGVFWGGSTINENEVVDRTWKGIFDFFKHAKLNGKPVRPLLYHGVYEGLNSVSSAMADLGGRKSYGKVIVDISSEKERANL